VLLGVVLTASVLLLVPRQATTVVGAEVLAMGLAAWGVCCGHPAAAAEELEDHKARSARGLRAAGGLRPGRHAAAGYRRRRCAGRGRGGLYWLVPGTVFPILVALFAAWVLLVEINR